MVSISPLHKPHYMLMALFVYFGLQLNEHKLPLCPDLCDYATIIVNTACLDQCRLKELSLENQIIYKSTRQDLGAHLSDPLLTCLCLLCIR